VRGRLGLRERINAVLKNSLPIERYWRFARNTWDFRQAYIAIGKGCRVPGDTENCQGEEGSQILLGHKLQVLRFRVRVERVGFSRDSEDTEADFTVAVL